MKYSEFLKENYSAIGDFIKYIKAGIWITDSKGKVIMVNEESLKTGGLKREDVIGKTTEELLEMGYILDDSSVLKAILSGKEESIVQRTGEGSMLVATSVPVFHEGELDIIICTEMDITDVIKLKALLDKQKSIAQKYKSEIMRIKNQLNTDSDEIVSYNLEMIRIKEMAIKIGAMDATVVITGESGTGKEVVANLIQKNSKRADKAFIKVNCAAIPETLFESEFFGYEKGTFTGANVNGKMGIFEMANGGTLFLDEIGELPLAMQSKVLRVLQEKEVRRIGGEENKPVDVRIIAATNRNLKKEMEKGNFRSDLYYRLFVVPINIPPLRQRKEDIAPLTNYFLNKFNAMYEVKKEISSEAIKAMEKYNWHGNVRELRNIIERLVVSGAGNTISAFQVEMCLKEDNFNNAEPVKNGENATLDELIENYEKQIIIQAVEECGTLTAAAQKLNVNKSTISRKLKKYGY
ncbi:MAG: sigma 54-interacting transcriptional regulator [Anaerovoracaceae bacterium]|nr:sigma 54-interacting transcriptional regulator [Anaerovoracaceae bacterium]